MAYQSLYRKYRPQRFGELVGQAHVTTALRNAVREGRVGHAYLFSGPRGTGKTTTARILAKALNCTNLHDGEPCGQCDNCVAIAQGRFLDLFELDAASNNSVDNIRDLTDSVHLGLGPASSRKVYLIDEVHQLSAAASNALLKTLEEPPDHVVFVLATTNPEKVLPTIRSRAQHFEFTLATVDEIQGLLTDVCAREGVAAEPEALATIARVAAGSMRDALSLLDQAIAHGALDVEHVDALLGGTAFGLRLAILEAVANEDVAGALVALGDLLEAGHEPRRITEDLLACARDAFLLNAAKDRVRVDVPDDARSRLEQLGATLGNALLVRTIETLGQAIVDMRGTDAADPRLVAEVAIVRLARRDAGPPLQSLADRVERLERALAAGGAAAPAGSSARPEESAPRVRPARTVGSLRGSGAALDPTDPPVPPSAAADAIADAAPDPAPDVTLGPDDAAPAEVASSAAVGIDEVILAWADILPGLPVATRSAVQEAQPLRVDGDVITFGVAPALVEAARPRFKREADTIRGALSARFGRTLRFNLVEHDAFSTTGARRELLPDTTGLSAARERSERSRPSTAERTERRRSAEGAEPERSGSGAREAGAEQGEPERSGSGAREAGAEQEESAAVDSVGLFTKRFDATVVEELPRD